MRGKPISVRKEQIWIDPKTERMIRIHKVAGDKLIVQSTETVRRTHHMTKWMLNKFYKLHKD